MQLNNNLTEEIAIDKDKAYMSSVTAVYTNSDQTLSLGKSPEYSKAYVTVVGSNYAGTNYATSGDVDQSDKFINKNVQNYKSNQVKMRRLIFKLK